MNITTKKLPHSAVQLHVTVEKTKMVEFFAKAFERLASTVAIKGFRPGTAPKAMVLERIGIDRYTQEAVNLAIIDTYYHAVHDEKLVPLSQPAVSIHEFGIDSALVYDATVDVLPEVELGDYKKINPKLSKDKIEATDEEVEIVLRRLRLQSATFATVDRATEKGDRVEVHFTGKEKGVVQDDLTSQHYPIILGDSPIIPGFEKELIGIKKGDTKTFKLKVDKREVDFSVDCVVVESVTLPELDKKFSGSFGHDSVKTLSEALKKGIETEKQERLRQHQEEAILESLQKLIKIELPESLVNQEIDRRIDGIRKQLGVTFDKFLTERYSGSLEDLRKNLLVESERSVSAGLILGEIAQAENLVPKGGAKTAEEQNDVMRSTFDKLIEHVSKK